MNGFLSICLIALSRLPIERVFMKKTDPMESVEKLETALMGHQPLSTPIKQAQTTPTVEGQAEPTPESPRRVTTAETIAYQRRELGKEILLVEKHLQQRCKIGGVACDCCEKHPIVIEALAQDALGMSADPVFTDIISWIREIAPMTTEVASQSGRFDEKYPEMAIKARIMRKNLMGTEEVKALLDTEQRKKVTEEVTEILNKAMTKEGGKDDDRELKPV